MSPAETPDRRNVKSGLVRPQMAACDTTVGSTPSGGMTGGSRSGGSTSAVTTWPGSGSSSIGSSGPRNSNARVISWGVLVSKSRSSAGEGERVLLELRAHEGSAPGSGRAQERGHPPGARQPHARGPADPLGPDRDGNAEFRLAVGGRLLEGRWLLVGREFVRAQEDGRQPRGRARPAASFPGGQVRYSCRFPAHIEGDLPSGPGRCHEHRPGPTLNSFEAEQGGVENSLQDAA